MASLLAIGMVALNIFQGYVAIDGLQYAFGFQFWGAVAALFVLVAFMGNFGILILNIFGFIGLVHVWGWAWWQALLVVFPGALLCVVALFGLIGSRALNIFDVLKRRVKAAR